MGGQARLNLTYGYQASAGQMGGGSTAGNAGQLMAVNNNSTIAGTPESAAYTYDNVGRLVTASQTTAGASYQRRFAYDRWGHRTGVWDAVSGGAQIQSIALQQSGGAPTNRIASVTQGSVFAYTYDAAGNVTSDGAHTYTYDAENRLKEVDGGASAAYAYDPQNRRIKKVVGSASTHYVWEGNEVIGEFNAGTGAHLADYVKAGGQLIAKLASGVVTWYVSDRLSVRLLLDNGGAVVGRQGHLPFGEEVGTSGQQEKRRFTSYERDGETNTDYAVNGSTRKARADLCGRLHQPMSACPASQPPPRRLRLRVGRP
ncbi:MAG TPA: hypothetical protein VNO70_18850 [Blastocatellia bacterium]|nr:hypothetical protein [Blastocatellia bacterium]